MPKKCQICQEQPISKAYFNCKTCSTISCIEEFRKISYAKAVIPKDKKCKGSTESTKTFGCGKPSNNRKFGLGIDCKCYTNWLLNSEQGKEHLKRVTIKITAPRLEMEQAFYDSNERKKLSYLLVNVRNICHEYIRERDKGLNCIACGVPYNSNFHASHFYKSELYSNLKYDENNIFGGCQKCNLLLEGNESGFRVGLIQRFGIDFVNSIDNKAKSYKKNDFKWDREALEQIRKYYQNKLKTLKQ